MAFARVKRGKMMVSGQDKVVIETPFKPRNVEVEFTKPEVEHHFPSCDVPNPDSVGARVFANEAEGVFGIELSWKVNKPREIKWFAKK